MICNISAVQCINKPVSAHANHRMHVIARLCWACAPYDSGAWQIECRHIFGVLVFDRQLTAQRAELIETIFGLRPSKFIRTHLLIHTHRETIDKSIATIISVS